MSKRSAIRETPGGQGKGGQQRSRQAATPYLEHDLSHAADGSVVKFVYRSREFKGDCVGLSRVLGCATTHPFPEVDPNKKGAVYRYDKQAGWKKLPQERPVRKGKCPLPYWAAGWQPG
jgi:hypothetical protein